GCRRAGRHPSRGEPGQRRGRPGLRRGRRGHRHRRARRRRGTVRGRARAGHGPRPWSGAAAGRRGPHPGLVLDLCPRPADRRAGPGGGRRRGSRPARRAAPRPRAGRAGPAHLEGRRHPVPGRGGAPALARQVLPPAARRGVLGRRRAPGPQLPPRPRRRARRQPGGRVLPRRPRPLLPLRLRGPGRAPDPRHRVHHPGEERVHHPSRPVSGRRLAGPAVQRRLPPRGVRRTGHPAPGRRPCPTPDL
ncbi:MAG: hypothetical protein AVDCRST_MAG48-1745, partial [uncultured Friedmanniella sp.]